MVLKSNTINTSGTSDLVKKAGYNTKTDESEKKIPNHDKYITTAEFNKLMSENFAARLKLVKITTQLKMKLLIL